MQLIGIGTDIQTIAPFQKHLDDKDERFFQRVFSSEEIAYCHSKSLPAQHFAARFSAKEAVIKAVSGKLKLIITQVCVTAQDQVPGIRFKGLGEVLAKEIGSFEFMLSISHSGEYATATVLAYQE